MIFLVASCSKDEPEITGPDKPPVGNNILKLPKKEFRAVWIATVWELDWPMGDHNMATQKQAYLNYLEKFKNLNINAIYFQVKGMGDAFYQSSYEPWSASITGTRGKDPGYDILKFLIDEAHKLDIEFHAWMNPYRIATRSSNLSEYPILHQSINPEWVVNHEKIQIYNPAIPEVRSRLADIVKELIMKYNVDGIHFDDYFYPDASSAGQMVSDMSDYQKYGSTYSTIGDFRRANVDKTIQKVFETIVATKPQVVFTVSPAPNQKSNYENLYADVEKWCREKWLDAVVPQLYQEIGNQYNDYITNLRWWVQNSKEVPVMVGHGFYKFGDPTMPATFQNSSELQKQFDISNANDKIAGNVQYSARYILLNKVGITDKLAEIYKNKAVRPLLGRKIKSTPQTPTNLQMDGSVLKWDKLEEGNRSIVYFFANKEEKGNVHDIFKGSDIEISKKGFYCVSAINSENNESKPSQLIEKK